ncbi:MAG: DUF4097 family beta strand repeat protein [Clostridia bacterium]|nr:DUF4097 family beta strand repeat protein [Clostridia bacterium]
MKKASSILLIVAGGCVAVGVLLCALSAALILFNPTQWNVADLHTVNHTVTDPFTNIRVEGDPSSDVTLLPAKEGQPYLVVIHEQEKQPHTVRVEDDTLIIQCRDERVWYDHIRLFSFSSPKITVYLPETVYGSLYVNSDTGDVETHASLTFGDVDIHASTGDITLRSQVTGTLTAKVSTGDIEVWGTHAKTVTLSATTGKIMLDNARIEEDVTVTTDTGHQSLSSLHCRNLTLKCTTGGLTCESVQVDGAIQFKSSTGRVSLSRIRCGTVNGKASTGDIDCSDLLATGALRMETSTGDVTLNASDAATLNIKTDTGDVEGTLLSDKIFYTETDTGNVKVPQSPAGGICEVVTDTGSITFKILS